MVVKTMVENEKSEKDTSESTVAVFSRKDDGFRQKALFINKFGEKPSLEKFRRYYNGLEEGQYHTSQDGRAFHPGEKGACTLCKGRSEVSLSRPAKSTKKKPTVNIVKSREELLALLENGLKRGAGYPAVTLIYRREAEHLTVIYAFGDKTRLTAVFEFCQLFVKRHPELSAQIGNRLPITPDYDPERKVHLAKTLLTRGEKLMISKVNGVKWLSHMSLKDDSIKKIDKLTPVISLYWGNVSDPVSENMLGAYQNYFGAQDEPETRSEDNPASGVIPKGRDLNGAAEGKTEAENSGTTGLQSAARPE